MNELTKRILFAIPATLLFISLAWLGGIYFNTLMAILALVTTWEVDRLMKKAGFPGFLIISIMFAAILWVFSYLPPLVIVLTALGALLPSVTLLMPGNNKFGRRWMSTLFIALYAPMGFLMAVNVREIGESPQGFWLMLALFFMIWGNDIFAYFGGKTFGKYKMAPNISPNKTWEGFGFGALGAVAGALIVWLIADSFPDSITLAQLIPGAFIVSITGPLGDLLESRLKRIANVKDSSSLLPGHGGLFDRFDAMIFTAPFLYFYFSIFV